MENRLITSILDTDLYKLTQQQAALELYSDAEVEYRFKNRGEHRFNEDFISELKFQISLMSTISLSLDEVKFIKSMPFFKPAYVEYLKNYRFDPNEVQLELTEENDLDIKIKGPWRSTILWEVPLMALISELYFSKISPSWMSESLHGLGPAVRLSREKADELSKNDVSFADFGTRRRRSKEVQGTVIANFVKSKNFVGTSNVYFAKKFGVKPIGTVAHEFIMSVAALESMNRANYFAMHRWQEVYKGDLGIALTDTYKSKHFFKDFDLYLSKLYQGVRHDSGDPFKFGEEVIKHYKKHKIDPMSKTIVFSDGLDVDLAVRLKKHFDERIKTSFGIGTHFTNHFPGHEKPLNMVIKLWSANGVPAVKLSDNPGKHSGDSNFVNIYETIYS